MPDHVYVYPGYLSKDGSRRDGRRVPSNLALSEVTLEALAAAARSLGLTAEPEPEKHYPRRFYRYEGRLKVTKKKGVSKAKLLRMLAEEIHRHPGAGAPP